MKKEKCIKESASPRENHPGWITPGASPPMHHPRCIALVHHLLPPPCWSIAPYRSSPPRASWWAHNLILSYSHTVTLSHPLLHPQDSVALIIAPNLEDGHRPNLLVLSNHLILKDHWPNLLGLNDYSVESTCRRWFHRLSGNKLILIKYKPNQSKTSNKILTSVKLFQSSIQL